MSLYIISRGSVGGRGLPQPRNRAPESAESGAAHTSQKTGTAVCRVWEAVQRHIFIEICMGRAGWADWLRNLTETARGHGLPRAAESAGRGSKPPTP